MNLGLLPSSLLPNGGVWGGVVKPSDSFLVRGGVPPSDSRRGSTGLLLSEILLLGIGGVLVVGNRIFVTSSLVCKIRVHRRVN